MKKMILTCFTLISAITMAETNSVTIRVTIPYEKTPNVLDMLPEYKFGVCVFTNGNLNVWTKGLTVSNNVWLTQNKGNWVEVKVDDIKPEFNKEYQFEVIMDYNTQMASICIFDEKDNRHQYYLSHSKGKMYEFPFACNGNDFTEVKLTGGETGTINYIVDQLKR